MTQNGNDPKPRRYQVGDIVNGTVGRIYDYGAFVEIAPGISGLLPRHQIPNIDNQDIEGFLLTGDHIRAVIRRVDHEHHHYELRLLTATDQGSDPAEQVAPGSQNNGKPAESESLIDFKALGLKPGHIRKILLVEDNRFLLQGFDRLLVEAGFEVEILEDAKVVVAKACSGAFDLIFLDAHTPTTNGVEAVQDICTVCPGVFIVLMSGLPLTSEEEFNISGLRRVKFLAKPFSVSQLIELFENLENDSGASLSAELKQRTPPAVAPQLALGANSESDLIASARVLSSQLAKDTGAAASVVFSLDLATRQVDMLASTGIDLHSFERCRKDLNISPVKDVILDGEHIFENDVLANALAKFRYLLPLLDFDACIGLPLTKAGRKGYGLFLFSPTSGYFTHQHQQYAAQIALTLKALLERWQIQLALNATHEFTLMGQSSAGLAHDVNNLIAALQLQMPLLDFYTKGLGKTTRAREVPDLATWLKFQEIINLTRSTIESLGGVTHLFQRLAGTPQGMFSSPVNVIENALQMTKSKARRQNITLTKQIPSALPLVAGNDISLERVLINLI